MSDTIQERLRSMADWDIDCNDMALIGRVLNEAADEIERLRERIKNLGTDLDRKIVTITRQRQRIEELEAILRRLVERRAGDCFEFVVDDAEVAVGPLESNRHIITTEQIDAAWTEAHSFGETSRGAINALAELGIVRRPNGHGWVKND